MNREPANFTHNTGYINFCALFSYLNGVVIPDPRVECIIFSQTAQTNWDKLMDHPLLTWLHHCRDGTFILNGNCTTLRNSERKWNKMCDVQNNEMEVAE